MHLDPTLVNSDSGFSHESAVDPYCAVCCFFLCSETNLKFKMGLKETDEGLQEQHQLAEFDGKHYMQVFKSV